MSANQALVNAFTKRYLEEYDNRYAQANLTINPEFVRDVEYVLLGIGVSVGGGFLGKLGSDLYDRAKSALFEKIKEKQKKQGDKVITIQGENRDKVLLNFGKVRPAFIISKGNVLILRDVTITYEGAPTNLIKEELAPSFFPINARFIQIAQTPTGPYRINESLIVGSKPDSSPESIHKENGEKSS